MMILSIASLISLVGLSIGAPLSETARKHPFKTLGHKAWKETKELTPIMIGGGVAAATGILLLFVWQCPDLLHCAYSRLAY